MSATTDLILERRQIRRRLAFWRIAAIIAIVAAVIAMIPRTIGSGRDDHLARIRVDGMIFDDLLRDQILSELAELERVKGVIVHINSPGGTVAGSEALYEGLRKVAAQKPVVAVMSEAAASGGYITAIAADHIVARGNTLTGSIGVIAEIPNIVGLMEMLGIDVTRVKSAPLKAEPSFTTRPGAAVLIAEQALIDDTFVWFKDLVAERRGLAGSALDEVTDGRVFTGRQALTLGLIDAIGDEETARDWLAENRDLPVDLDVVDYDWSESPLPWPMGLLEESLASFMPSRPVLSPGLRLYAIIQ
ncbi:MAG TPA: signal peptide peptidase SppA [Thermohalobaculum sp.]|nr:signal peptide peptidase SppA [Thermohalobaculum sp.]